MKELRERFHWMNFYRYTLLLFLSKKGGCCSIAEIQEKCANIYLSADHVRRALMELSDIGYISSGIIAGGDPYYGTTELGETFVKEYYSFITSEQ